MLLDLKDLADGQTLNADLCIVGAGAAGIALALEFIGSPLDVLILESGGLKPESRTQALYSGKVVDEHLHSPPDRYRQRRFGGSTTIWGGRLAPFDDIDFTNRDYVPDSGWPFSKATLLPFYAKANRLCEAGEFAYTVEMAFNAPPQPMLEGFHSDSFTTDRLERFSCPTDFGSRYGHKLRTAPNIRVLLHANLTKLRLDAGGDRVESATIRSLTGKRCTIRADRFVLATGGLEVARLLLANDDVQHNGIGNAHDVVGRYYMCHLAGTVGTLQVNKTVPVWNGYDISDEGIYCRRRLALTEGVQRRLRLGNFIARLHHPRINDPEHRTGILSLLVLAQMFIPYEYRKRLDDGQPKTLRYWLQHVWNVVSDPVDTAAFLWHWLRARTLAARKYPSIVVTPKTHRYSLDFHAEQYPNPLSRVTLDASRDELGERRLLVDWRHTQADVETVQGAIALFAKEIRDTGIGHFDYDPAAIPAELIRYGAYGGHHLGTARMGTNPRNSVVDADGRVHDVANLYIASAAVFPTSSQANPTLTIVALALRLSDHLKSTGRPAATAHVPTQVEQAADADAVIMDADT